MRKKVILHIGSDKAGSTAIQRHIVVNNKLLSESGVYIPQTGYFRTDGHHAGFFSDLNENNIKQLKNEVRDIDEKIVLMSWEGIHFLDNNRLSQVFRIFKGFDVEIIYYVRDQADVIQTGLLQEVKSLDREAHVIFNVKDEDLNLGVRNYYSVVKRIQSLVPSSKIDVIYYDRSDFPQGNIALDFFQRISPELDLSSMIAVGHTINYSLDIESAKILAFVEALYPDMSKKRKEKVIDIILAVRSLASGKKERYFLSEKSVTNYRSYFRESNQALVDEFGVSSGLVNEDSPVWNEEEENTSLLSFKIDCIDDYITAISQCLNLAYINHADLSMDEVELFQSGWSREGEFSAWVLGLEAELSGFLKFQSVTPIVKGATLLFTGHYIQGVPNESSLFVNGEHIGDFNLSSNQIQIPLSNLPTPYLIDIKIRNKATRRPCDLDRSSKDDRKLSYFLHKFDCIFMTEGL